MSSPMDYLDGNAAAGELSKIFAIDVTTAEGQCAHCGAKKRFAEAHVYMQGPGVGEHAAPSSCKCSRARVSGHPWHDVSLPQRGITRMRP